MADTILDAVISKYMSDKAKARWKDVSNAERTSLMSKAGRASGKARRKAGKKRAK